MQRRLSTLTFLTFALVWGCGHSLRAVDPVSRKTPSVFRRYLQEHLVPLKDVRAREHPFGDTEEDGIILIDEVVHRMDSKGRRAVAIHRAYQPRTEGGVEAVSTVHVPFRKGEQEVSVVVAHSIQPDGTTMEVQEDAAFVQTPQYEAEYSLYSDHAEVVIVFPNVKPGTIVEYVVVVAEEEFRIPGEFTVQLLFQGYWPSVLMRAVVELPDDMAERLRISSLGGGLPDPERQEDRRATRLTWKRECQREVRNESGRAPIQQIGPVIRLTTLPDWDAFAGWYNGLLKDRDELGRALRKTVDEWTDGITDQDEILRILLDRVANDIRYVGLEFGIGSFQPHACDEVWKNQYGDCKDKTNLLCAMLRHKGLDAYLALVNTTHAGLIPRDNPDYRHFTHVIAAVPREGGYVFCDPTIGRLPAGQLGPSCTNRDVVLIKPDGAEFARTPDQSCGSTRYDFDFAMSAHGELSGWMTRRTTGYWAAISSEYFGSRDRRSTVEAMRYRVEGFFPGCRIVDIGKPEGPQEGAVSEHTIKAYLVVPSAYQSGGDETRHLAFPGEHLLPYLEECRDRQTAYEQRRDDVRVTVRYKLPRGWSASDLPKPFTIQTPPVEYQAAWSAGKGTCTATFSARYPKGFVPHDEYRLLYNAVSSFAAWMNRPLALVAQDGGAVSPGNGPALDDFPVMPSGEGQLALLNEKFPRRGNTRLRREALERVTQWFPNDRPTVFEARVELVLLEDDDAKIADGIRKLLLDVQTGDLQAETVAWGEYMLGVTLLDLDQTAEAVELMLRLARDTRISAYRRGWSYYQAALAMADEAPANAITELRKAIDLDSEALPELVSLLAGLLLEHSRLGELRDVVRDAARQTPAQATASLRALIDVAIEWLQDGRTTEFETVLGVVQSAVDDPRLEHLKEDIAEAASLRDELLAYVRLRGMIKQFLREEEPDWYTPESLKVDRDDPGAVLDAIEENLGANQLQACLACAAEYLTRFPPDLETFGYALWTMARIARASYGKTDLPEHVLSWCDRLPESDAYREETDYVRARWLRDTGKTEEAVAVYERHLGEDVEPLWRVASSYFLGQVREEQGEYREALALYKAAEQLRESNTNSLVCMLRAAFINLELGNRDEAVRLILALDALDETELSACGSPAQVRELARLVDDRKAADEYWAACDRWWGRWKALEGKLDLDPLPGGVCVPVISDLHAAGLQIGVAVAAKDAKGALTKMRPFFHAARWQPTMAIETAGMHVFLGQLGAELTSEMRALAGVILESFEGIDDETEERRLLVLALQRTNAGKQEECYDLTSAYLAERAVEDERDVQIVHLHATAAIVLRKPMGECIAWLEKVLADDIHSATRAVTVRTLAQAYVADKQRDNAVTLLRREIDNPAVKANAGFASLLERQLEALTRETDQSAAFSRAAQRWLDRFRPDWYGFAEPATLDDRRIAKAANFTFEQVATTGFLESESCKAGFLVALAPEQPLSRKQRAFDFAVDGLMSQVSHRGTAREMFDAVIADEDFGQKFREKFLFMGILMEALERRGEMIERYRETEVFKGLRPNSVKVVERALSDAKAISAPPGDVAEFLIRSLDEPPEHFSSHTLATGLRKLVQHGALDLAQQVFDRLRGSSWEPKSGKSKVEVQLELLRLLRHAREMSPAHFAMRGKLLTAFPDVGLDSAAADMWLSAGDLPLLNGERAFGVRVAKLRGHQVMPGLASVWWPIVSHVGRTAGKNALAQEILRTGVDKTTADRARAAFVAGVSSAFDIDDPAEREQALALLRGCEDPEAFPVTTDQARFTRARIALRIGDTTDPHTLLSDLKVPGLQERAFEIQLTYYLIADDVGGLKRTLESMTVEQMIECPYPRELLAALERVGRTDEADLVRDALERELYKTVLNSWYGVRGAGAVLAVSEALGGKPRYPAAWTKSMLTRVKDEWITSYVATRDAWLRRDWDDLLAHSSGFLKDHPKFYDWYWYKGQALRHLDRPKEAAEALSLFVRYSHDNIDRPRAVKLLEELR